MLPTLRFRLQERCAAHRRSIRVPAAGKGIRSLLFEVQPGDPGTILGVGVVLGIVAVIACVIPARRVTTSGVTTLLRRE